MSVGLRLRTLQPSWLAASRRYYSTDVYKQYGATLNLPTTPYNTNAPSDKEQAELVRQTGEELYRWQDANLPRESTVTFHDGPPYANGSLHMGHAMNKVLKDIINRYNVMRGNRVDYCPGWDCHGLPIETTTIAKCKKKKKVKYNELSMVEKRQLCAQTAQDMAQQQLEGFRGFAVMADWGNDQKTYKTLSNGYVVRQLKVFKEMLARGLISRKTRPVFWSVESQTALAESELEYGEKTSTAVMVKYALGPFKGYEHVYLVIWTTTPWTLPSNQAIAANPEITYTIVDLGGAHGKIVVAEDLVDQFLANGPTTAAAKKLDISFPGSEIIGMEYSCLVRGDKYPVLGGTHVTAASGTGLVHTAPGHGMDDYLMCQQAGIDPYSPVNDRGEYTTDLHEAFGGLVGLDARRHQPQVVELFQAKQAILSVQDYTHNVPLDWRTKTPVLVRSTPQFFADISSIKSRALEALDKVEFTPASGINRLRAFTQSRTEWCISRQRVWGVPIPALYHKHTGQVLMTDETVGNIINVVEQHGVNAWFEEDDGDDGQSDAMGRWLPESLRHNAGLYKRGYETMDVWFDSGTSWTMLDVPQADYYLEGTDQHRGWFQSSLLTKMAVTNDTTAPFKRVLTHGFVMDKDGRKMSKSLGNVILPHDVKQEPKTAKPRDKLGIDGLRLWIAQTDYTSDVALSPVALQQLSAVLKKLRLTFKFLLGNLGDYGGAAAVPHAAGLYAPTDRKALHDLHRLNARCVAAYDHAQFNHVVQLVQNHMNTNLSAWYFDIVKDRVYADGAASRSRRSVQAVFAHILQTYLRILAPITPLMAQQVWMHAPACITGGASSPFMSATWTGADEWRNDALAADFDTITRVRNAVLAAMDKGRASPDKHIRSSLGTEVHVVVDVGDGDADGGGGGGGRETLRLLHKYHEHLANIFITSRVHLTDVAGSPAWMYEADAGGGDDAAGANAKAKITVKVVPPHDHKCPRCWQFTAPKEEALCGRCEDVLFGA